MKLLKNTQIKIVHNHTLTWKPTFWVFIYGTYTIQYMKYLNICLIGLRSLCNTSVCYFLCCAFSLYFKCTSHWHFFDLNLGPSLNQCFLTRLLLDSTHSSLSADRCTTKAQDSIPPRFPLSSWNVWNAIKELASSSKRKTLKGSTFAVASPSASSSFNLAGVWQSKVNKCEMGHVFSILSLCHTCSPLSMINIPPTPGPLSWRSVGLAQVGLPKLSLATWNCRAFKAYTSCPSEIHWAYQQPPQV